MLTSLSTPPALPELARARVLIAHTTRENSSLRMRLEALSETACDIFIQLSAAGLVQFASKKASTLLDAEGSPLLNSKIQDLFNPYDAQRISDALEYTMDTGSPHTFQAQLRQDVYRWYEFTATKGDLPEGPALYVSGQDITSLKAAESALAHQAMHDSLTGLPNRDLLIDRIQREIESHKRDGIPFTVVSMDLDGFKKANDSFGPLAGDEVLKQTARRLRGLLRGTDTVARIGADAFVLVLPHVSAQTELDQLAARVLGCIQPPFVVGASSLYLSASLGAAIYPQHGDSPDTLCSNAGLALQRAKELGRDRWFLFQSQLRTDTTHMASQEAALYEGIRNGEFLLHYQPICHAKTGRIAGVEALMRWARPLYGVVSPLDFIPQVEANGLINLLGAWALKLTAVQLTRWDEQGLSPIYATVNVSPRQFRQAQFLSEVRNALAMSKLNPNRLVLEITEGVLMQDPANALKTLNELVSMGLSISVDDFGTGYSSLAYLQKFPLSTLKIDKSFIHDLPENPHDAAIVSAVLALAKGMGLKVVAEGVELESQRQYLADSGCDFVQGWLTGRPQAATDLAKHLAVGRVIPNALIPLLTK